MDVDSQSDSSRRRYLCGNREADDRLRDRDQSRLPEEPYFCPVSYGWQGYINLQNAPDAAGRDFHDFYLAELAKAEKQHGKRLVDVFDVHWYPEAQGGGTRVVGSDNKPEVVAARIQAPRSLWDSTYTETSWITQWSTKGPIDLIHRLQGKIKKHYPGTKLSMTEYNYGGGANISGAIAQAEVLGIFGREGIFAANEWPMEKDESFIAGAFRMFRNFDGKGAAFEETSVHAETDKVADSSVYASVDSKEKGRIVVVAINKTDHPITARMKIEHALPLKIVSVYELTTASAEPKMADVKDAPAGKEMSQILPAYSVSTIVLSK